VNVVAFPVEEKTPNGVLVLNSPCDSSHNLKVGDFSLGFTLKNRLILIYLILALTFTINYLIETFKLLNYIIILYYIIPGGKIWYLKKELLWI